MIGVSALTDQGAIELFTQSLGWALLHSLWQGVVAALAVFIFRAATPEKYVALRCNFQMAALTCLFISFWVTFTRDFQGINAGLPTTGEMTPAYPDAMSSLAMTAPDHSFMWPQRLFATTQFGSLEPFIPWLGAAWIIGLAGLTLRYSAAYIKLKTLRSSGLTSLDSLWQARFDALKAKAGVSDKVSLWVSQRVSTPLTFGFLRPVILVPASFFTKIPAEQVEAILLHELAHIRRHDFVLNLLQTVIRIMFFYHPAVYYISAQIDHDRECACDDFAISLTQNPQELAYGLAQLRLDMVGAKASLAAARRTPSLVQRLERLLGKPNPRRRKAEVITVMTLLTCLGVTLLSLTPAARAAQNSNPHPFNQLAGAQPVAPAAPAEPPAPPSLETAEFDESWDEEEAEDWLEDREDKHDDAIDSISDAYEDQIDAVNDQFEAEMEILEDQIEAISEAEPFDKNRFDQKIDELEALLTRQEEQQAALQEKMQEEVNRQIEFMNQGSFMIVYGKNLDRDAEKLAKQAQRQALAATRQAEAQARRAMRQADRAMRQAEASARRAQEDVNRSVSRSQSSKAKSERSSTASAHSRAATSSRLVLETDQYRNAIIAQLRKDHLIDANTHTVSIEYKNGDMYVAGRAVPKRKQGSYNTINNAYGISRDVSKIYLSPNQVSVSQITED